MHLLILAEIMDKEPTLLWFAAAGVLASVFVLWFSWSRWQLVTIPILLILLIDYVLIDERLNDPFSTQLQNEADTIHWSTWFVLLWPARLLLLNIPVLLSLFVGVWLMKKRAKPAQQ